MNSKSDDTLRRLADEWVNICTSVEVAMDPCHDNRTLKLCGYLEEVADALWLRDDDVHRRAAIEAQRLSLLLLGEIESPRPNGTFMLDMGGAENDQLAKAYEALSATAESLEAQALRLRAVTNHAANAALAVFMLDPKAPI